MELVERYLQAVSSYLPKTQSSDIVAELKDSLLSQIEEREAGLGRALDAEELQALIQQNGHPMLVASRYLPQQHLIGPSVYAYWWFSLRLVLIIIAIVHGLLGVVAAATSGNPIQSLIHVSVEFAGTALVYIGIVTLVFALLDRHQVRIGFFDNWQPSKLAPVKDQLKIKRGDSLFELVFGVLFISWWLGVLPFPAFIFHDGSPLPFRLSDAWAPFWWGILALTAMDVILAAINLVYPYWKWDRLLLRVLLNVVCLSILWQLFQNGELIVLTDAGAADDNPARLAKLLNHVVQGVLGFVAVVSVIEIVQDVRRLLSLR